MQALMGESEVAEGMVQFLLLLSKVSGFLRPDGAKDHLLD